MEIKINNLSHNQNLKLNLTLYLSSNDFFIIFKKKVLTKNNL